MSFRRVPREIDPRRHPKRRGGQDRDDESGKARSYGQYNEISPEELAELERATGEVAREAGAGDSAESGDSTARQQRRSVEEREKFEDATGEVSREDEDSSR